MSEQNTISTEMLEAAAKAIRDYQRRLEFADDFSDSSAAEAALRAAGVPELVARIASAEQIIASRQSELNIARARIAELEAELASLEHLIETGAAHVDEDDARGETFFNDKD